MRNLRKFTFAALVIAGLGTASAASAHPGTPQDQDACRNDVMNYCMSAVGNVFSPNVPAIVACLKRNMSKLSPACRAVMSGKH